MSDSKNDTAISGEGKGSSLGSTQTEHTQAEDTQTEKFPSLPSYQGPSLHKSKSFTAAESSNSATEAEDMTAVVERLKRENPPPSLQEAREQRASNKEQRRASISLIRSRTASRASNSGRPSLEGVEKGHNA